MKYNITSYLTCSTPSPTKERVGMRPAFTLIEIMVSISIMSVILVAIMSVFFTMNDVSGRTEINRQLQWNIKLAIETMAEDVRKYGVDSIWNGCNGLVTPGIWNKAWCDSLGNIYYLGQRDENGNFTGAFAAECEVFGSQCYLLKKTQWFSAPQPLTNSYVHIKNLEFQLLWDESLPRLGIYLTAQPAIKKWVKSGLIKNNIMHFQTTISQSFLEQ